MQVEIVPADMQARPMIGPGGLSRDQAHAEIQSILDRTPELATVAAIWRRGAKDDTVALGLFTWTLYEHPEGEDPRRAAMVWLEDSAQTMRDAGAVNIGVAKLPE
jgi:hypothetical protein